MDKKYILVVDDSPDSRYLYSEVLKEAYFEVTTVIDGEEALREVAKGVYDLILLDIMMPVVNGIKFLRYLKTIPLVKHPKVILLTNLAHEQVIHEAMLLGAHSYLIKSDTTPSILIDFLSKTLGLKEAIDQ